MCRTKLGRKQQRLAERIIPSLLSNNRPALEDFRVHVMALCREHDNNLEVFKNITIRSLK